MRAKLLILVTALAMLALACGSSDPVASEGQTPAPTITAIPIDVDADEDLPGTPESPTDTLPTPVQVPPTLAPLDPTVSACSAATLVAEWGESGVATGQAINEIRLTNVSEAPCAIPSDLELSGDRFPDEAPFDSKQYVIERATGLAETERPDPQLDVGETFALRIAFNTVEELPDTTTSVAISIGGESVIFAPDPTPRMPGVVTFDGPTIASRNGLVSDTVLIAQPSADATPIAPGSVLSTVGLGAIRPGMSLQQAADATGQTILVNDYSLASEGCGSARIAGVDGIEIFLVGPPGPSHLDASITGVGVWAPGYPTPSGIEVGFAESAVTDRLDASRLTTFNHEYDGSPVWRFDDSDGVSSVTFDIDDRTGDVRYMGGGTTSFRIEGCA